MTKISFIVCPNGLGHLKRTFLFAKALALSNIHSNIFGEKNLIIKFKKKYNTNFKEIKFYSLNIKNKFNLFKNPPQNINEIFENFPKYFDCDILISDNLISDFNYHKKIIIYANFFWPTDNTANRTETFRQIYQKLGSNKTLVLTSKLFAGQEVRQYNNCKYIGLPTDNEKVREGINYLREKDSLLISIGNTKKALKLSIDITKKILEANLNKKYRLFLDPQIYELFNTFENCFLADYSEKMYLKTKFAFIRPGIGTLSECLFHYAVPFCFSEKNNQEMNNNIERIKIFKLGTEINDFDMVQILKELEKIEYIYPEIISNINNVDFDGAKSFVKFIKDLI